MNGPFALTVLKVNAKHVPIARTSLTTSIEAEAQYPSMDSFSLSRLPRSEILPFSLSYLSSYTLSLNIACDDTTFASSNLSDSFFPS